VQTALSVAVSPSEYGEAVSMEYWTVLASVVKQCAKNESAAKVLFDGDRFLVLDMIDALMRGALEKANPRWFRIHCVAIATKIMEDLSGSKVLDLRRKRVINSSKNFVHSESKAMLKQFGRHIPDVIDELVSEHSERLGLFGLNLMKFIVEFVARWTKRFGAFPEISNVERLCANLVAMALRHENNNLFLFSLKRFVDLLEKHSVNVLTFLLADSECALLRKFQAHYESEKVPTALKSFGIAIFWQVQQNEGLKHLIEKNSEAKEFMDGVVQQQIKLQQTQQKI